MRHTYDIGMSAIPIDLWCSLFTSVPSISGEPVKKVLYESNLNERLRKPYKPIFECSAEGDSPLSECA